MNINNTINFIKRGMNYENGLLRKGCFALGFFSLLAIVPGIVLGDEILTISIIIKSGNINVKEGVDFWYIVGMKVLVKKWVL